MEIHSPFRPTPTRRARENIGCCRHQHEYSWPLMPEGTIVGSSFVKPNQPGLGNHVANAAFIVAAVASGHGVGRALAEHAIEWARQENFSAMQFNFVVSTNTRAITLWKNLGFLIVATIPEAFQHRGLGRKVDAFVMHRFL